MFSRIKEEARKRSVAYRASLLFFFFVALVIHPVVNAQDGSDLPAGATVSALGQTGLVRSDGSFIIAGVPSTAGNFRVRLIHPDGRTAQSDCQSPVEKGYTVISSLIFGTLTPLPVSLSLTTPQISFTAAGQKAQLQVIANLQGGGTSVITADPCITYFSSNSNLISINESGLVTVNNFPLVSSTVIITALHEGVVGTVSLLLTTNPLDLDLDGDGMPNDYELRNGLDPTNADDAQPDLDGDGLTNLEEFRAKTDIRDADTDRDGISDGTRAPDGKVGIFAGPDPDPLTPEALPPACSIVSPVSNYTALIGETITFRATATDNVNISRVIFTSETGNINQLVTSSPYEVKFTAPEGLSKITLTATARDIAGNTTISSPITVNIIADPHTTVVGRVIGIGGIPVAGARVSVFGFPSVLTSTDGKFSIPNLPTLGTTTYFVRASVTLPDGNVLSGESAQILIVRGGLTDVGDILVRTLADYIYTNNNNNGLNTISAFAIDATGALTEISGSPYLTGGNGASNTTSLPSANRIVIAGNFLFAANDQSNNVSVFSIDPNTGNLAPVAGSPFAIVGEPARGVESRGTGISLAITPDNKFLFTANSELGIIASFSIAPNGTLTQIPLMQTPSSTLGIFRLAFGPNSLKVSPNGKFLFVSFPTTLTVRTFSIAADGKLTFVQAPGLNINGGGEPAGLEVSCTGERLYVGNSFKDVPFLSQLFTLEIPSDGVLTNASRFGFPTTGGDTAGLLLSPDNKFLFVSHQDELSISVLQVGSTGNLTTVSGSPFLVNADLVFTGLATNQSGSLLMAANTGSDPDRGINSPPSIYVFRVAANGSLALVPNSPYRTRQNNSRLQSIATFPARKCPQ